MHIGVICAPYISKRTGEICEASNTGYIDLSGNCFISFNNVYIKKENYKSAFSESKEAKSLFAKKTSRLLRVFLNSPEKTWTQLGLSKEANVSIGLTNELKPVSTGPNVLMFIPYDEGVFYAAQKLKNRNIVSNIQLYLDLYNYKGRGKEQAEYLREKVIGF